MKKYVAIVLITAVACVSATQKPENPARGIVQKMLKAIEANKGCTYTMHSSERELKKSTMHVEDIFTKVNVQPFKAYLKIESGSNKGTEILYVEGENNNKAIVNAGKFLPNLHFSPLNSMLTKGEHHCLLTSGFSIVGKIIDRVVKRVDAEGKFDAIFKYTGDVTWSGKSCYTIVIEEPAWTYTTYTAGKGETLYTIAIKLHVPEYSIMEYNGVKNFDEDLGGRTLKVPTSYARKTVLYIDKQNNMPVVQEMSDDKGVFERYEFNNLVVNPAYKDNEFTKDFEVYGF